MSVPRSGRLDAVLNAFRVALLTQDAAAQRILASGIDDVLVGLQAIGDALQAEIDALGPDVQPWQIERLDRLRALEEQALRELDDYGQTLNSLLPVAQTNAAAAGAAAASASVQAVAGQAVVASSFRTLSAPALREIIAATSTGPLRDLLDTFGATGSAVLRQTLLDGIGQGRNARVVGDAIQRAVGVSRQRAQVIARTEILRAGKQANLASFAANANLISGWEWHAFKGPRTCSACLIMDGTEFPTSVTFFPGHPQCRCVGKPILRDYPQQKGQTGRDYLESLPEADQRRLLGNGKYDAWKSGELELDDMVAPRYSDQWGTSYQEASLATSQANAAVRRAGGVAGTPVPTPTPAPTSVAPQVVTAAEPVTPRPHWSGVEYPTADQDLTPEMLQARQLMNEPYLRIVDGETVGFGLGTNDIEKVSNTIYDEALRRSGVDVKAIQQKEELVIKYRELSNRQMKSVLPCKVEKNADACLEFDSIQTEMDKLHKVITSTTLKYDVTQDAIISTIKDIDPTFGTSEATLSFKYIGNNADESLKNAHQFFPKKIWDRIANYTDENPVAVVIDGRARWDSEMGRIYLDGTESTSIHELWHVYESLNKSFVFEEKSFLYMRAGKDALTDIFPGTGRSEYGYKDNFINHYMGKVYGYKGKDTEKHYELMSMGAESVFFKGGEMFLKDEQYAKWFLQMLLRFSI